MPPPSHCATLSGKQEKPKIRLRTMNASMGADFVVFRVCIYFSRPLGRAPVDTDRERVQRLCGTFLCPIENVRTLRPTGD